MALRNAFDNLATESSIRRIANLLTFARDSADRIRVIIDNTVPVSGTVTSTILNQNSTTSMSANNTTSVYSTSSWNAIDAREPLKMSHAQRADFVKRNRWTY